METLATLTLVALGLAGARLDTRDAGEPAAPPLPSKQAVAATAPPRTDGASAGQESPRGAVPDAPLMRLDRSILLGADDGTWVALAPTRGAIDIHAVPSGERRLRLGTDAPPAVAVACAPDGKSLASLHVDGSLVRWDLKTGDRLSTDSTIPTLEVRGHADLDYAAEGERIVARVGPRIVVWDGEGEFVAVLHEERERYWRGYDVSPASSLLTRSHGRTVEFFDLISCTEREETLQFPEDVSDVALSPDGGNVAVGTTLAKLYVHGASDFEERWRGAITDTMTGTGVDPFNDPLRLAPIEFSPSGRFMATCTISGFNVGCWNVETGELLWRTDHLGGRMSAWMPLTIGEKVVVGDGGRHVWAVEDGEAGLPFPGDAGHCVGRVGAGFLYRDGAGFRVLDGSNGGEVVAVQMTEWVK